jgi:hypothetical protein
VAVKNHKELYGLKWSISDEFFIEAEFFKNGGYITKDGVTHGKGKVHHFKRCMELLFNNQAKDGAKAFAWHPWADLIVEKWVLHNELGIMGPSSSGKTFVVSACALCYWMIFGGQGVTVLISSTTKALLKIRIWNAMTKLFIAAKKIRPFLPGRFVAGDMRLVLDEQDEELQSLGVNIPSVPVNAVIAIACVQGSTYVGMSQYVGIKNDRLIMVADEASMMRPGFWDATTNLRNQKCEFKVCAMGNPIDQNDPLGQICQPSAKLGGWDGMAPEERTRTWETTSRGGCAIQICGYDTPNWGFASHECPHPYLLKQEAIEDTAARYGKESWNFVTYMLGMMPRGGALRRVITVSMCESKKAFEEVIWQDKTKIKYVVGLDASYSGVGGDRCVLTHLAYGPDVDGVNVIALAGPQVCVPINQKSGELPEEQIARFCRKYCEERGVFPTEFAFDSTGRGTLVSALSRLWSNDIVCIEFGGRPDAKRLEREGSERTEREAYGKNVTALWYASRLVIENEQMRNLSREAAAEGAMREWRPIEFGKVDVENKDDTKARLGRSPDLWDSLVVGIEIARRRGFSISAASVKESVGGGGMSEWWRDQKRKMATLRKSMGLTYAN